MFRAPKSGLIEGFSLGARGSTVSSVKYANDTIFLSQVCAVELGRIRLVLLLFGRCLGLIVNLKNCTLLNECRD